MVFFTFFSDPAERANFADKLELVSPYAFIDITFEPSLGFLKNWTFWKHKINGYYVSEYETDLTKTDNF